MGFNLVLASAAADHAYPLGIETTLASATQSSNKKNSSGEGL